MCTTCKAGYNLTSSGQCLSNCAIANCAKCSSATTCAACANGYYLQNNQCHACGSTLANCSSCSNANTCSTCQVGYKLTNNHTCIPDCPIASCQKCSQPYTCQACEVGFYLTNNACVSCGSALPGCVSCHDKNTCQACGVGFSLEGYSCVLTAPSASSEAVLTTQLPTLEKQSLLTSPAFFTLTATTTGLLALLFLLIPLRPGLVVEEHTYRPLAGAKLLLEQNGQTISQRLVNRFGVYSGFKVLRGNYLLKAMLPHYQFPYSSEHQRLNVSTNYYPQEITVRSTWQSLVVPVIYLTTVGDDGITPSLSKKQQILYQSNYYFWQASRYLAWLHPLSLIILIILSLVTLHPLYYVILAVYVLGGIKKVAIKTN